MTEKIVKNLEEWKEQLTPDQNEICINHGTERPFTENTMTPNWRVLSMYMLR